LNILKSYGCSSNADWKIEERQYFNFLDDLDHGLSAPKSQLKKSRKSFKNLNNQWHQCVEVKLGGLLIWL